MIKLQKFKFKIITRVKISQLATSLSTNHQQIISPLPEYRSCYKIVQTTGTDLLKQAFHKISQHKTVAILLYHGCISLVGTTLTCKSDSHMKIGPSH